MFALTSIIEFPSNMFTIWLLNRYLYAVVKVVVINLWHLLTYACLYVCLLIVGGAQKRLRKSYRNRYDIFQNIIVISIQLSNYYYYHYYFYYYYYYYYYYFMCLLQFVCLFVCLCTEYLKTYWTDESLKTFFDWLDIDQEPNH